MGTFKHDDSRTSLRANTLAKTKTKRTREKERWKGAAKLEREALNL